MQVVRIFTGPDGKSHLEDVDIQLEDRGAAGRISRLWNGPGVQFREVDGDYFIDYHNAPRRQLVVNLTGSVEIETGAGDRRVLGPGTILLAEDLTGQGHISRGVGGEPRTGLFVPLDDVKGD
jgi:hypothetical protein